MSIVSSSKLFAVRWAHHRAWLYASAPRGPKNLLAWLLGHQEQDARTVFRIADIFDLSNAYYALHMHISLF